MGPSRLTGWRLRLLALSVGLSVAGYLALSLWGGYDEVFSGIRAVGFWGIVVALGLALLNYLLRFVRWQMYLGHMGHPVPAVPSFRVYLAGFALTTTPGKAGEALRSLLLTHWRVPYAHSLAALVAERLSDLAAITLLALLGVFLYPQAMPYVIAAAVLLALLAVGLGQRARLTVFEDRYAGSSNRPRRVLGHAAGMLLAAGRCSDRRRFTAGLLLALAGWGAEALALWWILGLIGIELDLLHATFVFALAMLAGALSFMPGGLGSSEAVMIGLLMLGGAAPGDAVAATLVLRLCTLWFAVLLGLAALLTYPRGEDA